MKWIWCDDGKEGDYVEFKSEFDAKTADFKHARLIIGSDWEYVAYLNDILVSFGQYSDCEGFLSVDGIDISELLISGKNKLEILAYHMGKDFQVCRAKTACLGFEVRSGKKLLAQSDRKTECRRSPLYYAEKYNVTPQLGFCWGYDFTRDGEEWRPAQEVNEQFTVRDRPVKKFTLIPPARSRICAQGIYKADGDYRSAAEKMQRSWMSAQKFIDMTRLGRIQNRDFIKPITFKAEEGDGLYIMADIGRETTGYLYLDVNVPQDCEAMIGWGEHLEDLRIRTAAENRNFGCYVKFGAGNNNLCDFVHRIGCRYICIFVESREVTLSQFTVAEARYPFAEIKRDFGDRLLNKIYETGKRTLTLCVHNHYEDCVWREQALYGMDSRNQMLFGYGVFGENELPRAILREFSKCYASDGLPELCPPARNTITIPSFALFNVLALGENAEADYNEEFVREMLPIAEKTLAVFTAKLSSDGVHCFTGARYWNFYEWADGLDGGEIFRDYEIENSSDAVLTALYALSAKALSDTFKKSGNAAKAAEYERMAVSAAALLESFYDERRGLYASFIKANGEKCGYHGYTQALVLLCGAVPKSRVNKLVESLEYPDKHDCLPCTFATMQFKYDAIMKYSHDLDFCINEICEVFGGMLFKGATSYWETELGEAEFGDAGSLCHAWSAVPCYFMNKYLL